jgi:hypothetical protein
LTDNQCGKGNENRIDGEEIERTEEEIELQGGQPITCRADRRHQCRGDRHARDHVALQTAAHRHNAGQSAEEGDDHIVDGGTGSRQQL